MGGAISAGTGTASAIPAAPATGELYPTNCAIAACKVMTALEQDNWGISKVYVVPDKIGATSTVLGAAALLSALTFF